MSSALYSIHTSITLYSVVLKLIIWLLQQGKILFTWKDAFLKNACADLIMLLEQNTHHIHPARTTVSQQPLSVVSPVAVFSMTVTSLLTPFTFPKLLFVLPELASLFPLCAPSPQSPTKRHFIRGKKYKCWEDHTCRSIFSSVPWHTRYS